MVVVVVVVVVVVTAPEVVGVVGGLVRAQILGRIFKAYTTKGTL